MATRISRAKRQLLEAGAAFHAPSTADRAERLASVLTVLYLIFNEGHTASAGEALGRIDLAHEAIRLTGMALEYEPSDPEVAGLLALMLLTEARRGARTDAHGHLVPLEDQDRDDWDREMIAEGTELLHTTWQPKAVGEYQLQAAIASLHGSAGTAADTDWPQIALLYLWLERVRPTGPIRLARVVAVARAHGSRRALSLLDALDAEHDLSHEPLTHFRARVIRAHLLADLGNPTAEGLFREAASLADNAVERAHLLHLAAQVTTTSDVGHDHR